MVNLKKELRQFIITFTQPLTEKENETQLFGGIPSSPLHCKKWALFRKLGPPDQGRLITWIRVFFQVVLLVGPRNPKQPSNMYRNPVNNGINYRALNWC